MRRQESSVWAVGLRARDELPAARFAAGARAFSTITGWPKIPVSFSA